MKYYKIVFEQHTLCWTLIIFSVLLAILIILLDETFLTIHILTLVLKPQNRSIATLTINM